MKLFTLLGLILGITAHAGALQNSDFATPAQIIGAGGSLSQLFNITKAWDTVNSQQLSTTLTQIPYLSANNDLAGLNQFEKELVMKQIATPANPAANYDKLYFKNDDNLYGLNSAGVEICISCGGGGGTVTSVALADGSTTPIYSISGSPVVGAGTLTFSLQNQAANTILAGPAVAGPAAQPTFRALVTADIPGLTNTANKMAYFDPTGILNANQRIAVDTITGGLNEDTNVDTVAGPTGTSVNTYQNEVNAITPAATHSVNQFVLDQHFDRTGSGQDDSGAMTNILISETHEGVGTLAGMNAIQIIQNAGINTNAGNLTDMKSIPINASVGTGFTLGNYSALSLNFDSSAGTMTGNLNPILMGLNGTTGGNADYVSIDSNGNTTGTESFLRLQHGAGSVGTFQRIYGNMAGATTNNYDEINLQSSGALGGYYQGLSLSKQGNAVGNSTHVNLSDSGNVGGNENIININASGNVTGESALLNAGRSGTISGNGYSFFVNDNADYALGYQGFLLSKSGTVAQSSIGVDIQDSSVTTLNKTGLRITLTGSGNGGVDGLDIDTTGATTTANHGRTFGLGVNSNGSNINSIWSPTSGIFFEPGNQFVANLNVQNGFPLTGTAELGLSAPMVLSAHDNVALDPLGLGIAAVGFANQISVDNTFTVDKISGGVGGFSIPANGSGGGTVTDAIGYEAFGAISGGGAPVTDLSITNLYGFRVPSGFNSAGFAANAWGISVESATSENFMSKSLAIGTGTKKVANIDTALEIGSVKALLNGRGTTVQKNAITALAGMQFYDTTLNELDVYDGTTWNCASCSSGGSSTGAKFTLNDAVVLYTNIDGPHRSPGVSALTNASISMLNSGSNGSTTIQVNQFRAGALFATATAALASSGGNPTSASVALSATLNLQADDVLTVDVIGVADGDPESLTVEL